MTRLDDLVLERSYAIVRNPGSLTTFPHVVSLTATIGVIDPLKQATLPSARSATSTSTKQPKSSVSNTKGPASISNSGTNAAKILSLVPRIRYFLGAHPQDAASFSTADAALVSNTPLTPPKKRFRVTVGYRTWNTFLSQILTARANSSSCTT
jgi:hypothetical protein